MEEDKVYAYLVFVFILLLCYQQAVTLEHADTADSCKEQAEAMSAFGSEEGCDITLDLPVETTGYVNSSTTLCVVGAGSCVVAQVKIGDQELVTTPQTVIYVNGQPLLVASVTINDTSWSENGTIIKFALFDGLEMIWSNFTQLVVKGPPNAVSFVSKERCDGANVSWASNVEDDVDQFSVNVGCDGGFSDSFTLPPNSSFIFLKTSDLVNDSVCLVSVLAHNPAGWSQKQTTEVAIRADMKHSGYKLSMTFLPNYNFVEAILEITVNSSCERYFPAWIYLEYDKSCDSGIMDSKTLLFGSVYDPSICGVHFQVASFPKHKPHCAVKVHLHNHLSSATELFTTDTFETTALHIVPMLAGQYFLRCDFKNTSCGDGCALQIKGLVEDSHIKIATDGQLWNFPGPLPTMSTLYDVYVYDWAPSSNSTLEFFGVVLTSTLRVLIETVPVTVGSNVTVSTTPGDNGIDGRVHTWLIIVLSVVSGIIAIGVVAVLTCILCSLYSWKKKTCMGLPRLQTSVHEEPSAVEVVTSSSFTEPSSSSELIPRQVHVPPDLKRKKPLDQGTNNIPGSMVVEGNLPPCPPLSEVLEAGQSVESGMIVTQEQGTSSEDSKYVTSQEVVSSTNKYTRKSPKRYLTHETHPQNEMSARTNAIPDRDLQETFFMKAEEEDGGN